MKHAYNILLILITLLIIPCANSIYYTQYSTAINGDSATYDPTAQAILIVMNRGSTTGTSLDEAFVIKYSNNIYSRFDKIGSSSYLNITLNLQDSGTPYHQKAIFWGGTTRYLSGVMVNYPSACIIPYTNTSKCVIYKYDNVNSRWSEAYSFAADTDGDYHDGYNTYPYSADYCRRLQSFDLFDSNSAVNKLLSFQAGYSVKTCGGTCVGCPISSVKDFLGTMSYSSMTELLSTSDTIYKVINGTFGQPIMTDRYMLEINNSLTPTNPDVCADARKGVYFPQNNKIYCVNSGATDIGIVLNATNQSATDYLLSTAATSCLSVLADMDVVTSIECSASPNDCFIGGYHAAGGTNYSDIAYFDGTECTYIDDGSSGYNAENKTVYDIEYNPVAQRFVLIGNKMFADIGFTPSTIPQPLPVPAGTYYYLGYDNMFSSYILSNPFLKNLDGTSTYTNSYGFTGITYNPTTFGQYVCPLITIANPGGTLMCTLLDTRLNIFANNQVGYKIVGTTGSLDPPVNYQISSQYNNSYFGKVCKFIQDEIKYDPFNYTGHINDYGWNTACDYASTYYDNYYTNAVHIFNDTCASTIAWDAPSPYITQNTELTFNIRTGSPYVPLGNSSEFILFSLQDNIGNDIVPFALTYNETGIASPGDTCLWVVPKGANLSGMLKIGCVHNYEDFVNIDVFVNWINKSYTINFASQQNAPAHTFRSIPFDFYYNGNNIASFVMNTAVNTAPYPAIPQNHDGEEAYFTSFKWTSNPQLETTAAVSGKLDPYGSTDVLFTCTYTDVGTYATRLYNNPYYPQALNNFDDWISKKEYDLSYSSGGASQGIFPVVNGTPNFGTATGNATRTFLDSLFPPGATQGDKMLYSTFIIIITVVLIIVLMGAANMMYDMNVPAGAVAGIAIIAGLSEFIIFTFVGFYPPWLMVMFFIVCAGIVALIIKSVAVK